MLGFGIFRYEMSTLEECTRTVLNLKEPKTMEEFHRLIDMFGYYRNFISNFANIARPLNELEKTDGNAYKSKLIITDRWKSACQEPINELKKHLTTAPILAHP